MSWQEHHKESRGGMRAREWDTVPAASVTKHGMTFNGPFVTAFGLNPGNYIRLMFDLENRKIGIKVIPNGENITQAFKLQFCKGKSTVSRALHVTCQSLMRRFTDCTGRVYRAHLNPGERIIELALTPENVLK
jgi:hypothetical protein